MDFLFKFHDEHFLRKKLSLSHENFIMNNEFNELSQGSI